MNTAGRYFFPTVCLVTVGRLPSKTTELSFFSLQWWNNRRILADMQEKTFVLFLRVRMSNVSEALIAFRFATMKRGGSAARMGQISASDSPTWTAMSKAAGVVL